MLSDRILFVDGEAIVIDKPAGLPVDAPRDGAISLVNHMQSLTFGFKRWPVAVHRLDRDTSGCLLLARNPKSTARFARAFEERGVAKAYLAILAGELNEDDGVIERALRKVSTAENGWRMVTARPGERDAKPAVSHWQKLAVVGGKTLVRFRPETGRTHQLRVHALEGLGLAIVGDPIYGSGHGARRTLLHAESIKVARDGKPPVAAHAPFPDDFAAQGFTAPEPDTQGFTAPEPEAQSFIAPEPETGHDV